MNNTISVYETYYNNERVIDPTFVINVILAMALVYVFNRM